MKENVSGCFFFLNTVYYYYTSFKHVKSFTKVKNLKYQTISILAVNYW